MGLSVPSDANVGLDTALASVQANDGLYAEMSERDIAAWLDEETTTPDAIYDRIKMSVFHQLRMDDKAEKTLQKNTAFNRKTLKNALTNNIIKTQFGDVKLAPNVCERFLNRLTVRAGSQSLEKAVEGVVLSLHIGMPEQKLNDAQKDEADAVWEEIHYSGYKTWLEQRNRFMPGVPYEQQSPSFEVYHQEKMKAELRAETMMLCRDKQLAPQFAEDILNTKIDGDLLNYLAANGSLLQNGRRVCKARGKDPESELTMADVLTAMSNESTKAQVLTYFQNRSQEQKQAIAADPKHAPYNSKNKIGNVLGKKGRETAKSEAGGAAVIDYDTEKALKQGKSGPWRGYKKLYDRIFQFLKEIYEPVMAMGFVQNIQERRGTAVSSETFVDTGSTETQDKNQGPAWEVQQEATPEALTNPDVAGEFYNKAKARLLADKMRYIKLAAQITEEDYQDATVAPRTKQQIEYLQQRMDTAEQILKTQIPEPNSPAFTDPNYFAMLEEQIVAEKANKKNEGVLDFLAVTKNHSANDEMRAALAQFDAVVGDPNLPNQQDAKRAMAVELFHLGDKYQSKQISDKELDAITDRFVQSGALNRMSNDLLQLSDRGQQKRYAMAQSSHSLPFDSQDYVVTAVDVNGQIHDFVENDLKQNAKKAQYDQHVQEQARDQVIKEVMAEREL